MKLKIPRRKILKYVGLSLLSGYSAWCIGDGRDLEVNQEALDRLNHTITLTKPLELKVGEHLPKDLPVMDSCNNLDVVKHQGIYYLAFRTAPDHFASDQTLMHILHSQDGKKWSLEKTVDMDSDLREPRFLSLHDQLFFYFFQGGTDWTEFEPQKMYMTEKTKDGWSEAEEFFESGYVPWRVREHKGKAYMSVYYGRDIYETGMAVTGKKGSALILQSEDGRNWEKFTEEISESRVEELEFIFDDKGEIWGTVRFEGEGGGIIHSSDLRHFTLKKTPQKYDSALLFQYDDELYLIARRSPAGINNLLLYSLTEKRTAMYRLDREKAEIEFLFDLPSHGDTAFPALAPTDDGTFLLYNYSSPLEGNSDYSWFRGQMFNLTHIYLQEMTIERK